MTNNYTIGIDFGNTYSCFSVLKNNNVEIIPNQQGNRTTHTCISFSENEKFVGDNAYNLSSSNPLNTVFDLKRLFFNEYSSSFFQSCLKKWPFKVVKKETQNKNKNENEEEEVGIEIEVEYQNEKQIIPIESLITQYFEKLKELASMHLLTDIKDAIITVPVYYNETQIKRIKKIVTRAGLNLKTIIYEPIAALLAYGFEKSNNKKILIVDIGGSDTTFSLYAIKDYVFKKLSHSFNGNVGGTNFDEKLLDYCADSFTKQNRSIDASRFKSSSRSMSRMKKACQRAKRVLSYSSRATIEIDSLFEGIDYYENIGRSKFYELCAEYFQKIKNLLHESVNQSGLERSEIDEVILVGGASRIPRIQEIISQYFDNKELCRSINPDEAIAYGASARNVLFLKNEELGSENVVDHGIDIEFL
ncbi:heat shock 70 kda protein cognate 2 [Anaeramoeba flamelloides]|uniref:Heat shock 70 kDa protein cognate 2 n=1 Tax=Anaeramoeba flamelloides TaxID=1746091 RepID=A0ABQ8Z676_9EUKA|nr:heat shock 70 kda protein cognate 2 [Anaeramoeba flamelloides]